jgi:hypothetical protein
MQINRLSLSSLVLSEQIRYLRLRYPLKWATEKSDLSASHSSNMPLYQLRGPWAFFPIEFLDSSNFSAQAKIFREKYIKKE